MWHLFKIFPFTNRRMLTVSTTQYSMPGRLPLSLFDNIFLFYFFFTLTDSESYTVDGMRCLQTDHSPTGEVHTT